MRVRVLGLALLLVVLGCRELPTEPKTDPCPAMFGCPYGESLSPKEDTPSPDAALDAASRARDRLYLDVLEGRIQLTRQVNWQNLRFIERTVYLACPFYVANPDDDPMGDSGEPGCAKGKYSPRTDTITVTTYFGYTETIALLEWETRNRFLVLGGRGDLAH